MISNREFENPQTNGAILVEPAQLRQHARPKPDLIKEYEEGNNETRNRLQFEASLDRRDFEHEIRIQLARIARVLERIADESFP